MIYAIAPPLLDGAKLSAIFSRFLLRSQLHTKFPLLPTLKYPFILSPTAIILFCSIPIFFAISSIPLPFETPFATTSRYLSPLLTRIAVIIFGSVYRLVLVKQFSFTNQKHLYPRSLPNFIG